MASDLIYREDAKDFVRHAYRKGLNLVEYLDEVPAADVRPVVSGEWEEIAIIPDAYDIAGVITWASEMRCSKCGFSIKAIEGRISQYNFCPSCGADMRTREDDKTGIRKEQGPDGPI